MVHLRVKLCSEYQISFARCISEFMITLTVQFHHNKVKKGVICSICCGKYWETPTKFMQEGLGICII
jgi:hypothetical protein